MSCCGNKRKAWARETRPSSSLMHNKTSTPAVERKSRVFEFTGKRSKKIKGASSGRMYYFKFTGHRILVPYEDSFGMMAERDLKWRNDIN